MPVRRCALTELEAEVEALEKRHRILEIGYPDNTTAVIRFESKDVRVAPGSVETR